jgi:hypothetical protein
MPLIYRTYDTKKSELDADRKYLHYFFRKNPPIIRMYIIFKLFFFVNARL